MKKYKVGYTQGVFDMFHIGHLNLLDNAKKQCEYLIVGVNKDSLVKEYKSKVPVVSEEDRLKIVNAIKSVDKAILKDELDKENIVKKYNVNAIFIGYDCKNNSRWIKTKNDMKEIGVDVVFLPYTKGISSTKLREGLNKNEN